MSGAERIYMRKCYCMQQWYFVTKIVLTYCKKKKCSSDRGKPLKFEAESQELQEKLENKIYLYPGMTFKLLN